MQEFLDIPQHETGPEILSNPATPHDVGSPTDIPEIISPGAENEDPGQGLHVGEGLSRIPHFSDNHSNPDLPEDSSNFNKVSPNKGQQEGSKSSVQSETFLNTSVTSSQQLQLHEQLHSAVNLPSNRREVGTQTGDSSQNKPKFLQLVKNTAQKSFKRLTQKTRLGESCINLVNQEEAENQKSQIPQDSPSLFGTRALNVYRPLCKSLRELPLDLNVQEGVKLDITASLTFTPDILQRVLTGQQNVLPDQMVQIVTNKLLIETKRDKNLIENKPAEKPGPINFYIINNPLQSEGFAVVNNNAVPLSPNAVSALASYEESLQLSQNDAVLNSIVAETGKEKSDLIKALHHGVFNTLSLAVAIVVNGNDATGQDEVQSTFLLPGEPIKTGFSYLSSASPYNSLTFSSASSNKINVNQADRSRQGANRSMTTRAASQAPGSALRPGAGQLQPPHHRRDQGLSSRFQNPLSVQPALNQQQKFLGASLPAPQNKPGLVEANKNPYTRCEIENEAGVRELFLLPEGTSEDPKENPTIASIRQFCRDLTPFRISQLFTNCLSYGKKIVGNYNELFPSVLNEEGLPFYKYPEPSQIQEERLKEVNQYGKRSVALLDWLLIEDVGLSSTKKRATFFDQIYNFPDTLPILQVNATFQSYQNYQTMEGALNQNYVKHVDIPREWTSMVMCFGEYNTWSRFLTQFKIPTDRKKFETNLAAAEKKFYSDNGKNSTTQTIVYQTKQLIARFEFMKFNIDHLFMESYRGAMEPILTGRRRKETFIDKNGAVIIPALPNKIRGFEANSFINNSNLKLSGLVNFTYALFTHSIKDSSYLITLESNLAPWRYSVDKKTDDQVETFERVEELAKFLGIQAFDIDFTPEEIRRGFDNMRNGVVCEACRIYEQNYAQFNLPRQIQVALVEDLMRLQNVTYLLQTKTNLFNNLNQLTTSLQYIIKLNKTLEELGELIHEVQKKESSGQYLFKSVGPVIKNNLQAFFLEPLGRIRFVNPSLKGKEVDSLHQERLK